MFLLMHSMASSGVGSVITQLPTYSVAQLELGGFQISVLVVCILLFAIPAAIIYATCCASRCKPKTIQLGSIVWFIIFTIALWIVRVWLLFIEGQKPDVPSRGKTPNSLIRNPEKLLYVRPRNF